MTIGHCPGLIAKRMAWSAKHKTTYTMASELYATLPAPYALRPAPATNLILQGKGIWIKLDCVMEMGRVRLER